jgi:hypothetical protein
MQSCRGNAALLLNFTAVLASTCAVASADPVDVELRPASQMVLVGDPVEIGLYAVSANGYDQSVGLVGAVLVWDADFLALVGHSDNGPYAWDASGFPTDGSGVNDTFADGDAYYQAVVPSGGPLATATADGLLVTTLQFNVLPAATGVTSASLTSCIEWTCTLVLDRHPLAPGVTDVTGSIGDPVEVTIRCATDPQCDDNNPCTDDSCNASYMCIHVPDDNNDPDDGLYCNGLEYCDGGLVLIEEGTLPDCTDELACTTDTCNEATDACENEPAAGHCLIGGMCYSEGSTSPLNECERCDPLLNPDNWSFSPTGAPCGDPADTECDGADTCDGSGTCQDNVAPAGAACGDDRITQCSAADSCDGVGTCLANHYANGTPCNDGLFCTLTDACSAGVCAGAGDTCADLVCDEFTDECKGAGLELRPPHQGPYIVGETFEIGLYAVSETGIGQPVGAVSVILTWDPSELELLDVIDDGPYDWVSSGFPNDSGLDGLNNTFLDGNALYEAWGFFPPNPVAIATPGGLLVTTLQFSALGAGTAQVTVAAQAGSATRTRVLDGETPGLEITGGLGLPAEVDIIECTEDAHCNDGEFCNGLERCVGTACIAGTEPDCDDGVFCNGPEICEFGYGCASVGNPCPDPDSCNEQGGNCGGCYAPIVVGDGSRYLAVTVLGGSGPVALLVIGDAEDLSLSCVSAYVQADGTLSATPTYLTPAEWGTVFVGDSEIVPGTTYIVQTDCRFQGSGFLSAVARATTWVWGDVNHDGAVYFDDITLVLDGAQGIFHEGTSLENMDLAPCVPDGVIDSQDIASIQAAYGGAGFPCPVPCEPCVSPGPAPQPDSNGPTKNRYMSFVPGHAGERTALRLRFVDLPPPFDSYHGGTMWLGSPHDISDMAGLSDATPPTFKGAKLQCEPLYMDWSSVGVLHMYGAAVVPDAVYELQAINELCDTREENAYTDALTLTTSVWGDLVGNCSVTSCTPPNSIVDFGDVSAVVDRFRNVMGAAAKPRMDVAPATPDRIVDFLDIPSVIDAFRGMPYPYPAGSAPCGE